MIDKNVKSVNPVSARKPIKRKPKDKPKRPLSAYNYFFKEERAKISNAICCDDINRQKKIDPDLTADLIEKLKKGNGRVSFEELGKLIGLRWKDINSDPERASYYASLAEADKGRYKIDMEAYNKMKKQKSNEARWSSDVYHTMHAHGHQIPSPYLLHQWETTMPPYDMNSGHTGYFQGHHIDPNVSQAHYPGQIPPIGGYYDPYCVTGAYASHENQYQSNVPSNSYDDYSAANSHGSYPHSNRPAMVTNAYRDNYYLQHRGFYPQHCYSNNSRL